MAAIKLRKDIIGNLWIIKCGTIIPVGSRLQAFGSWKDRGLHEVMIWSELYGDIEQSLEDGYGVANRIEHNWYGDASDCNIQSSIIGNVIMKVYKARVTAQPGLDGSYKTASTYQFTLSAMDAKRQDEATYSIAYIKN